MDVALVEIATAGKAEHVFGENLLAEEIRTALDQRRDVPSAGEHQHDDRTAPEVHLAQQSPASFSDDPNQRDEAGENQADGAFGQNGKRDGHVEEHQAARQSFGDQMNSKNPTSMKKVSVMSTRAPLAACKYWNVVAKISAEMSAVRCRTTAARKSSRRSRRRWRARLTAAAR